VAAEKGLVEGDHRRELSCPEDDVGHFEERLDLLT